MKASHSVVQPGPARLPYLLLFTVLALPWAGCVPSESGGGSDAAEWAAIQGIEDRREEASPILIAALTEPGSEAVRSRAALAMGRIQSPTYGLALSAAASEGGAARSVRLTALFALGQMGLAAGVKAPAEVIAAATAATTDPDPEIAAAGLEAVGKLAAPGAEAVLLAQREHGEPSVRAAVIHGLFRLRFAPVWRGQTETPPELSEAAVQAAVGALVDPAPTVREMAAHLFSRYGDPRAVTALAARVTQKDEAEWVRLFAVRALGRSAGEEAAGRAEALAALESALGDPSARVRTEAVMAFDRLEAAADLLPFRGTLAQDDAWSVRAALARALGRIDPGGHGDVAARAGEPVLSQLLTDPSPTVQGDALGALARRRGAQAADLVIRFLDAERWTLRAAAVRAAEPLGAEAGKPLVERGLTDPDRRVQAAALEVWSALEGDPARLAAALTEDDLAVRGTAVTELADVRDPRKVEWLTAVYEASPGVDWVEVREGVATALAAEVAAAAPENAAARALLQRIATDDPGPSVRQKARGVLTAAGVVVPAAGDDAPAAKSAAVSPFLGTTFDTPPVVVLETTKGTLRIRTDPAAPIHVANFVKLVEEGFYDGLPWHRVVPNFVIQGGDPQGTGWGGPGYALRDEIHPTPYRRGTVGMPKAGKDTGGCQIFITHVPTPHLDGNYTVFGQVIEGDEVIDQIEVGDRIVEAYREP
jgi:cyclophilin family peptidyl-prolyl cis-trans isomerase/HEAT repeat protein